MNKRVLLIFFAILCMMLITPAEAKTWYVDDDGGADFTDIQTAIDRASSGDTIFVYSGLYLGFEVEKPYLNIIGEGPDLVTVAPNDKGQYNEIRLPDNGDATGTVIEGMNIKVKPKIGTFGLASNSVIRDCIFDGLPALELKSDGITFENNVISNGTDSYVLYIKGNSCLVVNNSIKYNNVLGTYTGAVLLTNVANNTIKNNRIESNSGGFFFYKTGNDNKIYSNSISNNSQIAQVKGTISSIFWNSTTPIKYTYSGKTYTSYMGNYWSDYTGTDENGDGIGDTLYVLPDNLGTDNYPLMQPYEKYFNADPVLTSIKVTPVSADLTTGSNQQFIAEALDQYGNAMENITFTWSSNNEAVGTVNSTGFFTTAAVGTTTVTASAKGVNGTAKVTVEATSMTTISVSPLSSSLTPGGTQQYSAVAKDQAGNIIPDVAFSWSSGNESIGTIDENGLFAAKDFGTATVTATNETVNGTAQVTVTRTDLVTDAIDAGFPVQGRPGTVNVTIKNTGPATTGAFNVSLLADNTEVGRSTVESIGIDETSNVVLPWTPSSDGEVNLTAVVDPENAVDSSTENNVLSKTVTVTSSSSDLSVSSASFTLYPIYNNTLKVNVTNSGGGNAAAFNVTAQIGETNTTVNIPELAAGNTTTISFKDIKRQVGDTVTITVTADPEDVIAEVNETNNIYTKIATISTTSQRYNGGRFSDGYDKVNNVVYAEGNVGVAVVVSGNYGSKYGVSGVNLTMTFSADDLNIPAGATIKSARLCQGSTWYGDPGFNLQFNGHETQEADAKYWDCISGQYAFDVTPYFNATGDNTAVLTSTTTSQKKFAYYATVLIVVYEADSEPYRQIWVNEGSDCLLADYGPDLAWGYTTFDNASTDGLFSASAITVLESDDGDVSTINFNGESLPTIKTGGSDPSIKYFNVTGALQEGENELGVTGPSYFNLANAVLEVTRVTSSMANFSADVVNGNSPLTVQFTDTSTGTPTNWTWDFGDGKTSTEQNPTHIYKSEGNYTVKLTVSNSLGSDSEEKIGYITVGSAVLAPEANFNSNVTSGNAPLTVQFKDESTNTPTSWEWNFGDGKTSTEQNPSHTYETVGTYTVNLTAMNYGGSNDTTKTDYITVTSDTSAPVARFTTDANSGQVPFTVKFTDTSAGKVSSWNWDFGDGSTSTDQNPTHTYVTAGSYNVTLTVTGPGGSNTATSAEPITVSAPLTSPSYNGGIPLTTAQSGTVSGGLWYDSYYAMETSAQKTFTLPDYTKIKWARLYVDVYDGHMQNNYRGNVTIGIDANGDSTYEIQKNETFDTAYSFPGEDGTGPVWLSDHMNRVTSDYLMWYNLTDEISGQTVNVQATSTKIDSNFDGRVKAMTLVVAYDDGDSDQVYYWVNQGHDTVNPDDTEYTGSTSFGTSSLASGWSSANLTAIYLASKDGVYTFNGTTLDSGVASGSYYGSNTWNISSLLGAGQDSAFAYNKQGSNYYKIPLALMSVRYTSASPELPTADFKADVTSGTAPLTVNFTDQSTVSPTSWFWDFGDGTNATDQNASHTYTSAGNYTVNLTVENEGGSDSEVKTEYIRVNEPLPGAPAANFTANVTSGTAPLTVQFTDASTGTISSYSWDFDNDGTVDSTEQNPIYTYDAAGNYTVNLTVANEGGNDSEVKTDYIVVSEPLPGAPVANFTANVTSGTVPLDVQFTDASTGNISSYSWDFDNDGTIDSIEQNPIYTYTAAGNYTVNLTVANAGGSDSEVKTEYIVVSEPHSEAPVANFTANRTSGKAPLEVQFTDASTGNISSYSWDFDNDRTVDSTEQSPLYTYASAGTYTVNLTVTGSDGNDSEVKTDYIIVSEPLSGSPVANFTANRTSGKAPLDVQFTDASIGNISTYSWDFNNDGTIDSTEQNPIYTYAAAGTYTVNLTVSNADGNDSEVKTGYIKVSSLSSAKPVANFSANPTSGKTPLNVKFTDTSTGSPTSWFWNFGDGSKSYRQDPIHKYSKAGIYTVNLTVKNAKGRNTVTKTDYIKVITKPVANFTSSVTSGKTPLNVKFTDTSTGIPAKWIWDFGDGSKSFHQNPIHKYSKAGIYTVNLTVKNAKGRNTVTKTEYIKVITKPVANFTSSVTSGKAPLKVTFTDTSTGIPDKWIWDFGDGSKSSHQNLTHKYSKAGTYTVNLTVKNAKGRNTVTKTEYIKVVTKPVADFSATPTFGKTPLTVEFTDNSTGVPTAWKWSFGDGTTSREKNPEHQYLQGGSYKVTLTVVNVAGSSTVTKKNYIKVTTNTRPGIYSENK
ncbi:PKD domain-containing protein [Methanosarcina barkeri]|uniref:Cell surface protein n=1 Tax=Methanosarcina barkeri CM1 TaxID=796385 RepID=A0A0G3CH20_METBA|nr:PKD domain-containing protein [Methanosarcina barkeri]AKJ38402.1 cell surface protein [Methanosarcina barkeri CM1]